MDFPVFLFRQNCSETSILCYSIIALKPSIVNRFNTWNQACNRVFGKKLSTCGEDIFQGLFTLLVFWATNSVKCKWLQVPVNEWNLHYWDLSSDWSRHNCHIASHCSSYVSDQSLYLCLTGSCTTTPLPRTQCITMVEWPWMRPKQWSLW